MPTAETATLLAVICSSRRLFDGFSEAITRRRTVDANQFRLVKGLLEGAPVVAVLPHERGGSLTRVVAAIVDGHHPRYIAAVGEGTSVADQVCEGELVVGTQLIGPSGERLELDGRSPAATWVHCGPIDVQERGESEALAIDGWSWQNANACRSAGVPLVAVTAITQPCASRKTAGAELLQPKTTLARRTGTFAGLMWREPRELKRAWQLQSAAWQACDRAVELVRLMAKASVKK